jgi:hypothetical protein
MAVEAAYNTHQQEYKRQHKRAENKQWTSAGRFDEEECRDIR